MKRILLGIILALFSVSAHAQSLTGQLTTASSTCGAAASSSIVVLQSAGTSLAAAAYGIAGTWMGTVTFYATANRGATWTAFSVTPSDGSAPATTATGNGNWNAIAGAYNGFCAAFTTATSGTASVTITLSTSGGGGGGGGGGSGSVIGTAGDSAYFSGSNAVKGGTVVLDMAGIAGADLGAKMVACDALIAALSSASGICKGDNLATAQTLSTDVITTAATVFTFCGQKVTGNGAIVLATASSSTIACRGGTTTFTQGAAIQFVVGDNARIENLILIGNPASGNDQIVLTGMGGQVRGNTLTAFSLNGIDIALSDSETNGPAVIIEGNTITSDTTSTGSDVAETVGNGLPVVLLNNNLYVQSSASYCFDNSAGGGATVEYSGGICQFLGDSAGGVNLSGGTITNTEITTSDNTFTLHNTTHYLLTCTGPCAVTGNIIQASGDPMTGHDGGPCIEISPVSMSPGQTVITGNVLVNCGGTNGQGAIQIDDNAGATDLSEITISGNTIRSGETDGMHDSYGILFTIANAMTTVDSVNITGNVLRDFISPDTHHVAFGILNPNSAVITSLDVDDNTIENYDRGVVGSHFGGLTLRGNRFNGTTTPLPSGLAPVVASGFGTSAAVTKFSTGSTNSFSITIGVGTSNTGTGVLTLPAATTGWTCSATDVTTTSTTVSTTKVVPTSTTSVTFQNYTDISGTHAWLDSDVLNVQCNAY